MPEVHFKRLSLHSKTLKDLKIEFVLLIKKFEDKFAPE
jgi:hypothetical protein